MAKYRLVKTRTGKYRVQEKTLTGWDGVEPKMSWFRVVGIRRTWTIFQENHCDFRSEAKARQLFDFCVSREIMEVLDETDV